MRGFFTRIVGGLARLDPVEHLGDPGEVPEPDTAPDGRASSPPPVDAETVRRLHEGLRAWDPDGPPVQTVTDVEPEVRPWDTAREPVAPPPGISPTVVHCDGRHGVGHPTVLHEHACDICDATTDLISEFKALERRVAVLETQVAQVHAERKEKQS